MAHKSELPKIFHAQPHDSFIGHLVGRMIKPVIIADFDLLKEAFAKKELCSRFGLEEVRKLESKWRSVRFPRSKFDLFFEPTEGSKFIFAQF